MYITLYVYNNVCNAECRFQLRNKVEFAEEQCFQFGVKELWRDGKRRGFNTIQYNTTFIYNAP